MREDGRSSSEAGAPAVDLHDGPAENDDLHGQEEAVVSGYVSGGGHAQHMEQGYRADYRQHFSQ